MRVDSRQGLHRMRTLYAELRVVFQVWQTVVFLIWIEVILDNTRSYYFTKEIN